jgi:hypothetical protein
MSLEVILMFKELFELSQQQGKGLMFYIKGQCVNGSVTTILGDELVEVQNQEHDRILIRVSAIDAVAMS